jgi:uncharacterized lipoprotein YmbA
MTRHFLAGISTLCLTAVLLSGCGISPRVTYYTLNVAATPDATAPPLDPVAIGPVTIPELLDRPLLVVRTAANRVDVLETHRWAEPLKSEIPKIIAADLTQLLNQTRVSVYPQNASQDADYRVLIDIQRFEMTAAQGNSLEALWTVRRSAGGAPLNGRTVVSEPAGAAGYDALVAAQGRALAVLSRDLAKALRAVAAVPR